MSNTFPLSSVTHNPYRYLGVYANASTKERVANQTRINAFLKVGRAATFPLDLPSLLGPVSRSAETIATAVSQLTLPADQLRYAQFWWMKVSARDDIAFNHLLAGNVQEAQSLWEKKADASSLQNRIVLALVRGDLSSAVLCAETLYTTYAAAFVAHIAATGVAVDGTTLAHTFLDTLLADGIPAATLSPLLSNGAWRSYLADKTIGPLIDSLTQAIALAQSSRGKGPSERYKAGETLMNSTKSALQQLRSALPTSDLRYSTIADKLGLEILQCGIDYYNGTSEDEAPHKAMTLQKYALTIVVGPLAKERCKENVDILTKIISELPPTEVVGDYRAITDELQGLTRLPKTIDNAIALLKNTKGSLQRMKATVGVTNPQYLRISTTVVSVALGVIIDVVNAAQDAVVDRLNTVRKAVDKAWEATLLMDAFDMEHDFKVNRYNPNRATLRDIRASLNPPSPPPPPPPSPRPGTSSGNSYDGCFWIFLGIMLIGALIRCGG